jgi:hypothetical protein
MKLEDGSHVDVNAPGDGDENPELTRAYRAFVMEVPNVERYTDGRSAETVPWYLLAQVIADFNDDPSTTDADLEATFDRAILRAEREDDPEWLALEAQRQRLEEQHRIREDRERHARDRQQYIDAANAGVRA